jgi:hypothetical protein
MANFGSENGTGGARETKNLGNMQFSGIELLKKARKNRYMKIF